MPRNSSGTYTLPEASFVPDTVIESAPMNSNLSDIATALTQSLAITGVSTMVGPLLAADGTLAAPSITFDSDQGSGLYLIGVGNVGFAISGVKAFEVASDLDILLAAGISPGNTDNADPDTLDWYEEGSFTPALAFGGATTGITYTTQVGTFTRIGDRVYFEIEIVLSNNGSASGNVTVTGLPYAASSTTPCTTMADDLSALSEFFSDVSTLLVDGNDHLDMYIFNSSTGDLEPFDSGSVPNNAKFYISGHYKV